MVVQINGNIAKVKERQLEVIINLYFFFENVHLESFLYFVEQHPGDEREILIADTIYWELLQGYLSTSRMQLSLEGNQF